MGTHPIFESDFDCLTDMASSSSSKTKLATETEDTKSVTITARAEEEVKPPERRSRVQFTAETVDNEGMGRKSSKVCCIYKKPKQFGESSSESDSSDDDVSPYERKPKAMKKKHKNCSHDK